MVSWQEKAGQGGRTPFTRPLSNRLRNAEVFAEDWKATAGGRVLSKLAWLGGIDYQ